MRFDEPVAVITGAGGGLGWHYALELARRGARVVVNDLGCSKHGEGSSPSSADEVVAEIKNPGRRSRRRLRRCLDRLRVKGRCSDGTRRLRYDQFKDAFNEFGGLAE